MATLFSESNNIILKAIMRTKSQRMNRTRPIESIKFEITLVFGALTNFHFISERNYYYEMESLFLEVALLSKGNSRAVARI